jgi:hypothetical protein
MALLDALSGAASPAIYRDASEAIIGSSTLLDVFGAGLAEQSLKQAHQPPPDATPVQALRAADALEVAVQLRLRDYAARWDLFACLDSYRPTFDGCSDESYPRAVLRAIVACIEQWEGAGDLVKVAQRIAGLLPSTSQGGSAGAPLPQLSDSDTGLALSRISVLQALRADNREALLGNLNDAAKVLGPALGEDDDRPDILIASDLVSLLQQLVAVGRIEDAGLVDRLRENVRELIHLDPGRSQWVRDRVSASHQAWAQLAFQLSAALDNLSEPSWYRAAQTVDRVIALYSTTTSIGAFRRSQDDQAVRVIIAPTLESGFASQAALLRHLQDHVEWLTTLSGEGTATREQLHDLQVARELREAALERFKGGQEALPKGGAGASEQQGMSPAELEAAKSRVDSRISERLSGSNFTLGNLVADTLLERIREGFRTCTDYRDDVEEAADLVSGLLVRFLWDRNQLGAGELPYLYNESASEEDLANDLHQFLRASGSLGSILTEVRRIGGGRVDIQFGFPGFNLYVELKVDATKTVTRDKLAYLRQAASYAVADQRIGFLVVLKLLSQKKTVAPHLLECVDVVEVPDGEGARHIAALTLSGARTRPSDM